MIYDVVPLDSSTRILLGVHLLKDFNRKTPNKSINSEEAVGYGDALQVSILAGCSDEKTDSVFLLDAAPLTLGTETADYIITALILRNTTVPTKSQVFSTYADIQPAS